MSALDLLTAEMQIVCREADGVPWTLDDPTGTLPPAANRMTLTRMKQRLTSLVDEYVRDGSLTTGDEAFVRDVIDGAIARTEAYLQERLGTRPRPLW